VPSAFGLALFALLMLALAGGAAAWMGPDILKDLEIRKDLVIPQQARITEGRCKTKLVLVTCDAKLAYSVGARRYTTSVDLFFIDVHFGDYSAGVVRSASKPELATLDIGLDKLWNRIGTLLVIAGFFLAVAGVLVIRALQAARLKRIARTTDDLTPLAVTVGAVAKSWFGKNVACSYEAGGRRHKFSERLRKSEEPFLLGGSWALAVPPANSPTPILVDEALSRLDLTDAERRTLYAARAGLAPGAWPQATAAN